MTNATFVKTWVWCLEKPFDPKAIQIPVEEILLRKQLGLGCCVSDASTPKGTKAYRGVIPHAQQGVASGLVLLDAESHA